MPEIFTRSICISAIIFFPSFLSLLASSNLGSKPSLINPPSLANIGGSSTRASVSKPKNLSCSGNTAVFSLMSFGKVRLERIFDIIEDCSNPFLIATRSRGPALSNDILDKALSKSGTFLSSDRRLEDKLGSAIIKSSPFNLFSISSRLVDGAETLFSNNLAPPDVKVWSITERSEPDLFPEERPFVSSKFFLVAVSIVIKEEFSSRRGLDNIGSLPFCVICKYSIMAPIDDSSALLKVPKPSTVSTLKIFFKRSRAELLSKAEFPSSVTLIPNSSAKSRFSLAKFSDSRISLGESLVNSEPNFSGVMLEM